MKTVQDLLAQVELALSVELQKPNPAVGHLLKLRDQLSASSSLTVQSVALTNSTTHTVTHNKGYNPFVRAVDSSGREVASFGLSFPNSTTFVVTFNPPFTGRIFYI